MTFKGKGLLLFFMSGLICTGLATVDMGLEPSGMAYAQIDDDDADDAVALEEEGPRLYQLLYDHHFDEPLNSVGQRVRIWIWLDYMSFDKSQLKRLLRLSNRFQAKVEAMEAESHTLVQDYEARLLPQYESLYAGLKNGDLTEEKLDDMAVALETSKHGAQRDEALRKMRAKTLRGLLGDEKEFLYSLSPEQEQKLVSSLFFLRTTIDPFSNPGTYRDVVGSTWHAGDFTALLRGSDSSAHLDIGGIWGIEKGAERPTNYAHIKRNVILFYALKEVELAPTIQDYIATKYP